jgi:hypothetical protein
VKFIDDSTGEVLEITPRQLAWLQRMAAVDEVGDSEITDLHRHASRGKLFEQVDRQIRARISNELPRMLDEHRGRFEATLGADKIQTRMNELREHVDQQIRTTAERFEATVDVLVDNALRNTTGYYVKVFAERARKAIGSVVAREVARQYLQVFRQRQAAAPAKPAKRAVKKKAKRQ